MLSDMAFPDFIGMIGVSLVLVAYTLLNLNKLTSHNMIYLLMNLIGSIFLLFSLFFHWNLSSVVIEIAWITISLIGIFRVFRSSSQAVQNESRVAIDEDADVAHSYK